MNRMSPCRGPGGREVPKAEYPQYETLKEKFEGQGKSEKAAETSAARITNSQGGKVPPPYSTHPRTRRKP